MNENEIQNVEEQSSESVSGENNGRNISTQIQSQRQTVEYSSPIPLPQILKGYKEVDPTFPERIMAEFEKIPNAQGNRNKKHWTLKYKNQSVVNIWRFFYQFRCFV